MSSDLVEAVGLTKRYRGQESAAVSDVSFTIAAGETVGFLGPNGAGKTTLIKLICGVTAPTSGFVNVVGADPVQDPIRAKSGIGAMHQSGPFDMMLPAIDNLKTAARFRGLRWRDTRPWVLEISEYLGVASVLDNLCFQLSGGQRQRVQLVRALLTIPKLLILDEPSAGLDVVGRRQVEQFVGWLGDEFGVTVLWTTHHIEELERNSSRVMVVDKGKILRFSSPGELVEEFGSSHLLVTVDDAAASSVVARWAKEAGFTVESEGVEVRIHGGKAREIIPELSRHCLEADIAITGVTTASDSLEKVFLHMTESDR